MLRYLEKIKQGLLDLLDRGGRDEVVYTTGGIARVWNQGRQHDQNPIRVRSWSST